LAGDLVVDMLMEMQQLAVLVAVVLTVKFILLLAVLELLVKEMLVALDITMVFYILMAVAVVALAQLDQMLQQVVVLAVQVVLVQHHP
jgi:hypothetical protein